MLVNKIYKNNLIRSVPYPYTAMLAICSDLDETPDKNTYLETIKYLNTKENTQLGRGVGLEVGNTIYFDMPPNQFSYWNSDNDGRSQVRKLIKSGHIDCLHSFGDLANTRKHAEKNIDELYKHNCKLEVWVDHGISPSNFDEDIMHGQGDRLGSKVYHADITKAYGIKYVWKGRVTSIIGQNQARSLNGIFKLNHPVSSLKTIAKEVVKGFLAQAGNQKYKMHALNNILRKRHLRNGAQVYEFIRANPHWGGVSCCETAVGVPEILTRKMLDRLINRQGICILYTHLGKIKNGSEPFPPKTRKAFELLAQYSQEKKILVTTTRRVLGFCRTLMEAEVKISNMNNKTIYDITFSGDEKDLNGLTLCVDAPDKTVVKVNGKTRNFMKSEQNHKEPSSIYFPWNKLEFPDL